MDPGYSYQISDFTVDSIVFGVILVRIFPTFSRLRTEYGEILGISSYSVQMQETVRKMQTRITPNTDTFYAVFTITLNSRESENQCLMESGKI